MNGLVSEKCEACHEGSPPVTDEDIAELSAQVPEWRIIEEGSIRKLRRAFRFPDFAEALDFTNKVGELAEREGHHPRLTTEWGKVTVTWWTHAIDDLHRNDFVMAAKTDQVAKDGP
jgi:4a-hydroxytetrahydrobiopterin dehydratase